MKKAIINYGKEPEADLFTLGNSIADSMEGNLNFPSPSPTIPVYKAELADYGKALSNSTHGGRNAVAIKNTLKASIVEMTRDLAMYVNTICKGNIDMITTTAFPLTKDRAPVHLVPPVIKSLAQGLDAGSIILKASRVKGAKSFIFFCAVDKVDGQLEWVPFPDSRSRFEFTGLEEGKKYWFKVVAIGSNNQAVSSEEAAQYVMQRTLAKAA